MTKHLHLETLAIHAGQASDPTTGAVMTPIYQTSIYVQNGVGDHKGYDCTHWQSHAHGIGVVSGGVGRRVVRPLLRVGYGGDRYATALD